MSIYASGTLATRFGDLEYNVTDGEHVHIGTFPAIHLLYKGTYYYVSVHASLYDDVWQVDHSHISSYTELPKKRQNNRKMILDEVMSRWQEFASNNPDILRDAQKRYLASEIGSRNSKINEMREQIKSLENEIRELDAEYCKL